jgi:YVTN family beta-propeller protein
MMGSVISVSFSSNSSLPKKYVQVEQQPITKGGIHVDNFPVGIAVNPVTNKIYVTNQYSNTVSVIDGDKDTEEETISVGALPYDVDVDHLTNRIYVANLGSHYVSVIDGETNREVANITNIRTPVGLDVDPTNSYLYVTSIDTNTLLKVDTVNNKVVDKTTKVGLNPYTVDIKPRTNKIYVSNLGSNDISVIDGDSFTSLKNITVGNLPVGLAASPRSNTVYVANRGSDTVSVIDSISDTVIKNLTVGHEPNGIDINFRTNMIYVTNTGSSTVSVIDDNTKRVVKEIKVNNNISPELLQVQVLPPASEFPNVASFVDTNRETNMIYVTNTGSSTVSVIDGDTNKLQVGLSLKISPPNSGLIKCRDSQNNNNATEYATNRYVRIDYGKKLSCTSIPYSGNTFTAWSDSRQGNATIASLPSDPLTWIISWFGQFFSPQNSPAKEFAASEYGMAISANFRAGPDYVAALIVPLIFTAISAIITAVIIAIKRMYQKLTRKFNEKHYMKRYNRIITDAFDERSRSKEEAFQSLAHIRNDIRADYYKGNIYEKDYKILMNKISKYLDGLR